MSMGELLGIPVRISEHVPHGWEERENAPAIRAENLEVLAQGGRLIDCENPREFVERILLVDRGRDLGGQAFVMTRNMQGQVMASMGPIGFQPERTTRMAIERAIEQLNEAFTMRPAARPVEFEGLSVADSMRRRPAKFRSIFEEAAELDPGPPPTSEMIWDLFTKYAHG